MKIRTLCTRRFPYYLVAWLSLSIPLPTLAMPPLPISFDGNELVIGDLAPGSEVVYFSVSRFSTKYVPRTERISELLTDSDVDGEIRVRLERPAPPKFVAVAVELSSGRYGLLTPSTSPVFEIAAPADSLLESPGQRLDRLEEGKSYIEILLVRPGGDSSSERLSEETGAWALTTGDGTVTDESPASDGLARIAITDMLPVGTSPPPPLEYETGDILVRVAPENMEFYVNRIKEN